MSNGAVMSPQSNHADNNNDAKKVTETFIIISLPKRERERKRK